MPEGADHSWSVDYLVYSVKRLRRGQRPSVQGTNGDGEVPVVLIPYYSLDDICILVHNEPMAWEVEFTDEFGGWWDGLNAAEQESVNGYVEMLEAAGPALTRPYADTISNSKYHNMRELRVQHQGRPYRVLYAFDPRRTGVLLLGGDKTGNNRWYEEFVPKADAIFAQHLREIKKE